MRSDGSARIGYSRRSRTDATPMRSFLALFDHDTVEVISTGNNHREDTDGNQDPRPRRLA